MQGLTRGVYTALTIPQWAMPRTAHTYSQRYPRVSWSILFPNQHSSKTTLSLSVKEEDFRRLVNHKARTFCCLLFCIPSPLLRNIIPINELQHNTTAFQNALLASPPPLVFRCRKTTRFWLWRLRPVTWLKIPRRYSHRVHISLFERQSCLVTKNSSWASW